MDIHEIRIYAEVLEQGLYFYEHIINVKNDVPIKIININKGPAETDTSLVSLLRNQKKFDLLLSVLVSENINDIKELPVLLVEYSTAVKTDDHEWQRFDGIFWATYYRIPYLKISSERMSQTAGTKFGGGSKLTVDDEKYLIHKNTGIMHHIEWETLGSSQYLQTHQDYYSCPPHKKELEEITEFILLIVKDSNNISDFYETYIQNNSTPIQPGTYGNIFPPKQSSRLKWDNAKNELTLKINRFGHAMDPERGGLAFFRMISNSLPNNFIINAEFQIQRQNLTGRESYNALFDGVSNEEELISLVQNIFSNDNIIDIQDAIQIFSLATNTQDIFVESDENGNLITLNDGTLDNFLNTSQNSIIKNILFYADRIILTDLNRAIIVQIIWSHQKVEAYFSNRRSQINLSLTPLLLRPLVNADMKEDLITYSCLHLLRICGLRIIAVSYPDAQGERCVLIGNGRNVKRKYIDIIAISERKEDYDVILHENKEDINNSGLLADIEKMVDIRDNNIQCLRLLIGNVTSVSKKLSTVYIGIGGKQRNNVHQYNIDYLMLISIELIQNNIQRINWTIGLVNMKLVTLFHKLQNANHSLVGHFDLENELFVIDDENTDKPSMTLDSFL